MERRRFDRFQRYLFRIALLQIAVTGIQVDHGTQKSAGHFLVLKAVIYLRFDGLGIDNPFELVYFGQCVCHRFCSSCYVKSSLSLSMGIRYS